MTEKRVTVESVMELVVEYGRASGAFYRDQSQHTVDWRNRAEMLLAQAIETLVAQRDGAEEKAANWIKSFELERDQHIETLAERDSLRAEAETLKASEGELREAVLNSFHDVDEHGNAECRHCGAGNGWGNKVFAHSPDCIIARLTSAKESQ